MSTNTDDVLTSSNDSPMTTLAFSEADLAHGVTRWLVSNFGPQLVNAVASTPFSVPLLCAIAGREADAYWLPFTTHERALRPFFRN